MFTIILISTTFAEKADKDFSVEVELRTDVLDISDTNLTKGYDSSRHFFWVDAIITNEAILPKKFTYNSCSGYGFKIESDSVRTAVVTCKKNYRRVVLLQHKEIHKIPLYLSFEKDYTGNTLKFRIGGHNIRWSKFVTVKLLR